MSTRKSIPLPKSNPMDDMETESKRRFATYFDIRRFEIREPNKDKGNDLVIELKENGEYTNFQFVVQLKSTASKHKAKDGSISYPIPLLILTHITVFKLLLHKRPVE
jgi:hypothetical protein